MLTNGRPPLPPVELGRTGAAVASDLAELAELQAKLLAADARSAARRGARSAALLAAGAVLLASALPILLVAFAAGLVALGLPGWAALLIAAVVGALVGAGVAYVGVRGLAAAGGAFGRSRDAFSQNLAWAKRALSGAPSSAPPPAPPAGRSPR